jgi:cobalt/nickel transport protein
LIIGKKIKLFFLLAILVIVAPLGLITNNPAWGEWGTDYFKKTLGFVPDGISNANNLNIAPFQNYEFINNNLADQFISALLGVTLIFISFRILQFLLKRKSGNKKPKKEQPA